MRHMVGVVVVMVMMVKEASSPAANASNTIYPSTARLVMGVVAIDRRRRRPPGSVTLHMSATHS